MSDREVIQQALEALEAVSIDVICRATHHKKKDQHGGLDTCPNTTRHITAIHALRTAMEQQAEPVDGNTLLKAFLAAAKEAGVTHLQQSEPVGEVIDERGEVDYISYVPPVGTALYTSPQQQAEPVAWMDRDGDVYPMPEIENWSPPHTMLYTVPPQRQWVGMTDEDFLEACQIAERGNYLLAFQRIQIKLKEKNT